MSFSCLSIEEFRTNFRFVLLSGGILFRCTVDIYRKDALGIIRFIKRVGEGRTRIIHSVGYPLAAVQVPERNIIEKRKKVGIDIFGGTDKGSLAGGTLPADGKEVRR